MVLRLLASRTRAIRSALFYSYSICNARQVSSLRFFAERLAPVVPSLFHCSVRFTVSSVSSFTGGSLFLFLCVALYSQLFVLFFYSEFSNTCTIRRF